MRKVRFNVFQNNQALKELKTKGYSLYNFEEIFIDDSKNHIKIASNEYQITGNTAIVDQGQNLIVGFSDRIVKQLDKPRIIFGDHTKAVKFIDFPFILGADGTKVLKLIHESVLEKYVYYFLKYVEIPNLGYARHFKYIKELVFPIPSLSVQKDVINIFTKIDQQISLRQQQLQTLATLVKSRFYEMFGDPILNEKNWKKCHLKDIATEKLSYGSGASAVEFSGLRYIRITDIDDNGNLKSDAKSPSSFDEKYLLNDGDILFARSGATVGKTFCYSRQKHGRAIYAGYLIRLVPDFKQVNSTFVYHFTNTKYYDDFIFKAQKAVAQPNINAQQYGELDFILPPLTLQNQFADFVAEVDKSQLACQKSLDELETLKKSLMQAYFG